MDHRHRSQTHDLGIRAVGLAALLAAYAALHALVMVHATHPRHWQPGAIGCLFAAVGFVGTSAGCAMLTLGAHLFDKVAIAERWRMGPREQQRRSRAEGRVRSR